MGLNNINGVFNYHMKFILFYLPSQKGLLAASIGPLILQVGAMTSVHQPINGLEAVVVTLISLNTHTPKASSLHR